MAYTEFTQEQKSNLYETPHYSVRTLQDLSSAAKLCWKPSRKVLLHLRYACHPFQELPFDSKVILFCRGSCAEPELTLLPPFCSVVSPIDGKSMESISSVKIFHGSEYKANGKVIRWTEVGQSAQHCSQLHPQSPQESSLCFPKRLWCLSCRHRELHCGILRGKTSSP